ncbi:MAG: TrkH family potassium uptake protein, partial [Alistipes sp.]|nr:TrkH family potassium uptake protein [Alistipes sp.]
MRVHVVIRYIGMVLVFIAAFMLASAGVSLVNNTDSAYYPLLLSSFLTALLGVFPLIFVPRAEQIKTKEGYCIVVGSWLVACIVGMFPYLTWGGEFSPMNAWFESVSGFTTTGASILNDVEDLPRGLLFWRMSTAWIGGIGVVMFALVILPSMGKNKLLLSNVELSTIAKDNYKYRTQVILRILIFVYVGLTLVTTLLLKLAGMCWFDAATHAMSACSTCGFGTKNASVAFFDSVSVEVILIAAMTLA